MRTPASMQTIQVEITSACVLKCSNCTRFCGTHKVPFFLDEDEFKAAIDSLVEYSKLPQAIVGFMGGEPLLHPKFTEFCEYALSKIPREKLGLWSTFPAGGKYPEYRDIIVKTFGNILLNDHSRDDILHAPVLMAAEEYFRKECSECHGAKGRFVELKSVERREDGSWPDVSEYRLKKWVRQEDERVWEVCSTCNGAGDMTDDLSMFAAQEKCWVQESWSASINPKGAWFCEVAAALSDLFDGPEGWKVEPGWWKRTPKDFAAQMDWACRKCGAALPIERIRNSQDVKDDVSPGNLERLKAVKSRKVAKGEYEVRDFKFDPQLLQNHGYPQQTYKEFMYRQNIAARYGILLILNDRGYWEPTIRPADYQPPAPPPTPLYQIMNDKFTKELA